ncbi:Dbl homology domain-containing protein, partial [Dichotomocladium elegans]
MPVSSSSSSSAGSIYLRCRSVLDALAAVPGFNAYYHADDKDIHSDDDYIPRPFYRLWQLCRKGRVLCHLFNLLKPVHAIDIAPNNKPKALVYRFIIACRKHLQMNEDNLFTVSEMYLDDTNGFVKVINTLEKILVLLKQRDILTADYPPPEQPQIIPQTLSEKVIFELLETERKYVQDLETLQRYAHEIRSIISLDMIHHMFGNLNALMDFQLRFLLFAEYNADASTAEEQRNIGSRFGRFIVQLEDAFSVYEPYCANLQHGLDMAVQLAPQLSNTSIEPTYELPSYLIKPVQRVCKYPLLLQQLIVYTTAEEKDEDADVEQKPKPSAECRHQDLLAGMEAIQRVASKVNETRRTQENKQWVMELQERVADWRGITDVDRQCGPLLLHDRAFAHQAEASKEVSAHLFEKTILLCNE